MRILQVGLGNNPGGIESFVMDYYRQLLKRGIQFDFICMYSSLAYEDEIRQSEGIVFYTTDVKKEPVRFMRELYRIIKDGKYEVVHINMLSAANILPLFISKIAGVKKIIAHSHNSSTPGMIRNVLHHINKPLIPLLAHYYFACSNVAAEWMFSRKQKVTLINNAIDVEKFLFSKQEQLEMRKKLNLENKIVIGNVGRFEEQKNHTFLIELFSNILKYRKDVVLLLVGDGELRLEIEDQVNKARIEQYVYFLGIRKDICKLWQAIDVFVLPSIFEGLPIVAVEAQAAGVKCIFSDTITKDVDITGNVEFLSLDADADIWARFIIRDISLTKSIEDNIKIEDQFASAGYDVRIEARKLEEFYRNE